MRRNLEARAEKLQNCEKALREAGLMTMVPLQNGRGLSFATIVLLGTSLYGVGIRDDDQWSEAAQAALLELCAQDGLSGIVLMGRAAEDARSMERVQFIECAPAHAHANGARMQDTADEAQDTGRRRSCLEMTVA